MSTPEGRVLKAICDYLKIMENQKRCVFWRQNNGATFDHRRGVYRTPNGAGAKAGVPDIAVILNGGRFVAVECKSMSGRLSDGQKAIKSALEGVGAVYVVARGVRDIEPLFAPPLPSSRLQPHGD